MRLSKPMPTSFRRHEMTRIEDRAD